MDSKYDIFISYRRIGGAQYARIVQLKLMAKGFRVFLDYDELKDSVFSEKIAKAIASAPIYIIVLSSGCLDRCVNENDWVRKEILLAVDSGKHIVPINPDNEFKEIPEDIPEKIKSVVSGIQHSEVLFGQNLDVTIDKLVKDRIQPYVRRTRFPLVKIGLSVVLAALIVFSCIRYNVYRKTSLQQRIETSFQDWHFKWHKDVTVSQLKVIRKIVDDLVYVEGGSFMMGASADSTGKLGALVDSLTETPALQRKVSSFWMGKYEVSVRQWGEIMKEKYDEDSAELPKGDITYNDCLHFTERLSVLSGLDFSIPEEDEWEYAARGGKKTRHMIFSGSNDPAVVSRSGQPYECDYSKSGLYCNELDLCDMSGNLSEWTSSPFRRYEDLLSDTDSPLIIDENSMVIRGGNFHSEDYGLTVTHREPMNAGASTSTVGMRLIIKINGKIR